MHFYYNQLTKDEREFVDILLNTDVFKFGRGRLGYPLLGGDSAERAIDALARWVLESRPTNV
jgi:hypothetical protein